MTNNIDRSSDFDSFACSREGQALQQHVFGVAARHLAKSVAELDPNWHSVRFCFSSVCLLRRELTERPLTDKDACRLELDYRPTQVVLVGPRVGHMLLTEEVFGMVPEPILALMCSFDFFGSHFHTVRNPKHVIELVDGKTIIEFENCTKGVVRNVRNDDAFDVETLPGEIDLDDDQTSFTRASLKEQFKIEACHGQAVDVDYFPLLGESGPIRNVDEFREAHRIAQEKWETEYAVYEAARERARAEDYAALSLEEKKEYDQTEARLEAQLDIVNDVLPLLP